MRSRLVGRALGSVVGVSLLVATGGCRRGPATAEGAGAVVATVGDSAITEAELAARFQEQPAFVRSRYDSLEKKKEFVDNLVRFELLVQEARRQGLEQDPEVQEVLEKVLVQRLVKVASAKAGAEPSDSDVKAYYEANVQEFVKPERVRVSHILLAAPRTGQERQSARARAQKLAGDLQKGPDVLQAFDAAARTHSQDAATQVSGGDLGFRSREELEALGGAALAQAAFALSTVGQVSPPVESDQGVHVLMLQSRQVGMEVTLDQARERIVQRLASERRAKALDALVASLREKSRVQVNDDVVAKFDPTATRKDEAAQSRVP